MKITWFLFISCVLGYSQNGSHTAAATPTRTYNLELIATVPIMAHAESIAYDPSTQLLYVSVQAGQELGDGSIATLKLDGTVDNKNFSTGLNNPKGIAIYEDKLYVSDQKELVEIELASGKVLKTYSAGDEKFLNDVAVDELGNIYVSDMSSSSIYKLDTSGNYTKWLSTPLLENPNGLLVEGDHIYVAAWGIDNGDGNTPVVGRFLKVDLSSKKITPITANGKGSLDGLQRFDENYFLISDWRAGTLHLASNEGEYLPFFTSQPSVGDLLYIANKRLLALPLNRQNQVVLYRVKY